VTRQPRRDTSHLEEDDERDERRSRRRREPTGTSIAAVVSLVLGILSFCLLFLAGIPAIILGILGLRAINRSGGQLGGRGMAIGGIILGVVGLFCTLPVLGLIPAYYSVRTAATRLQSQNNLRQLALALQNYHDTYGRLPPAVVYDHDGKPLYSWRVLILPFLETENGDTLYKQFHLDEAWDSPNNKPLLARMPKVYAPPGTTPGQPYATYYQVFDGPGAAFDSDKAKGLRPFPVGGMNQLGQPATMEGGVARRFSDFTDGLTNTFLIVEAGDPVPWSKPGDLRWDPNGPLPKLGGALGGDFLAVMADGGPRLVKKNTPERAIRAAITANGGEADKLPD
jgi:hypothetical protein